MLLGAPSKLCWLHSVIARSNCRSIAALQYQQSFVALHYNRAVQTCARPAPCHAFWNQLKTAAEHAAAARQLSTVYFIRPRPRQQTFATMNSETRCDEACYTPDQAVTCHPLPTSSRHPNMPECGPGCTISAAKKQPAALCGSIVAWSRHRQPITACTFDASAFQKVDR